MTSNIGSEHIQEIIREQERAPAHWAVGGQDEELKDKVMEDLRKSFKPEFLNRVDEIIIFNKLTENDIADSYYHRYEHTVKHISADTAAGEYLAVIVRGEISAKQHI